MQQRIKNISQHIILKNIAGAFILFAFLLSITPRQTLHSLTANHKDQPSKKNIDKDKLQFNEVGFNCDCNSIVATSPFTGSVYKPAFEKLVHFSSYEIGSYTSLASADHFYFKLRGPPVMI